MTIAVLTLPSLGWREAVEEQRNLNTQKGGGTVRSGKTVPPSESAEYVLQKLYHEKADVTELHLSNGAVVVLKPIHDGSGIITLEAVSPGGLTALEKHERIYAAIAPFVCIKPLRLQRTIDAAGERISGRAEKENWETFFSELAGCFEEPVLADSEFREGADRLSRLLLEHDETPADQLLRIIATELRIEGIPAYELDSGILENLNRDLLGKILSDRFSGADDFTFVLCGDFSVKEIEPYIRRFIASLPAGRAPEQWERAEDGPVSSGERIRSEAESGSRAAGALLFNGEYDWSPRANLVLKSITVMLEIHLRDSLSGFDTGGGESNIILRYSRYPQERYAAGVVFETETAAAEAFITALRREIELFCANGPSQGLVREVLERQRVERKEALDDAGFWKAELVKAYIHSYDPDEIAAFDRLLTEAEEADFSAECVRYVGGEALDLIVFPPR